MSIYLSPQKNQMGVGNVYIQPPCKFIITGEMTIYSGEDSFVQIILENGKVNVFKNKIIVEGTRQYLVACQFWQFITRDITFMDYFKSKLIINNHLVVMKDDPLSYYLTSRGEVADDWDIINTTFDRYKKMRVFW